MANDTAHHSRHELGRHEYGRDGISGLVTPDRALRAREISKPTRPDREQAGQIVEQLLARLDGRTRP